MKPAREPIPVRHLPPLPERQEQGTWSPGTKTATYIQASPLNWISEKSWDPPPTHFAQLQWLRLRLGGQPVCPLGPWREAGNEALGRGGMWYLAPSQGVPNLSLNSSLSLPTCQGLVFLEMARQ